MQKTQKKQLQNYLQVSKYFAAKYKDLQINKIWL